MLIVGVNLTAERMLLSYKMLALSDRYLRNASAFTQGWAAAHGSTAGKRRWSRLARLTLIEPVGSNEKSGELTGAARSIEMQPTSDWDEGQTTQTGS